MPADEIEILLQRGAQLSAAGFTAEASEAFASAYASAPGSARVQTRVGDFMLLRGNLDDAHALFSAAASQGDLHGLCGLVEVRERRGELHDALKLALQVPGAIEHSLALRVVVARVLDRLGRTDEAVQLLLEVDLRALSDSDAAGVSYLLGDLHHAQGRPDRAFAAWRRANARRHLEHDRAAFDAEVDAAIASHPAGAWSSLPTGSDSERPVFIVGVPRSGTSLVEQILAAHPSVYGAGELPQINGLFGATELTDAAQIRRAAAAYLAHLDTVAGSAPRVTDKMPYNALRLGFIAQLFPRARVIHCRRDPEDTALSIYGRNFSDWHTYATDLGDIAAYIAGHERIMEHWRSVLPLPILEVEYETLVQRGEPALRELVEHLDLPWDDAVLQFHRSARPVATASYAQVQRPLYTSSIGRARAYSKQLRPFRKALSRMRGA